MTIRASSRRRQQACIGSPMVFSVQRPIKPGLRPPPAAAASLTDRPTEKKAAAIRCKDDCR